MRATIHKYPLRVKHEQTVNLSPGAEILDVQVQGDEIVLWAIVNPDAVRLMQRRILMFPTGGDAPFQRVGYIGTVQFSGYVWHFFENGIAG